MEQAERPKISDDIRQFLKASFEDAILRETEFRDEQVFHVKPEKVYDICQAFLDNADMDVKYLADITAVDWLGHEEEFGGRFEVLYNLYSIKHSYRFFLKAFLPSDNPTIASVISLWNGANWMEREVWDLFGIEFTGHPNLSKILTADDLEGHPLRRDYPLTYEVPQFTWNKDDPPEVIK